MKVFNFMIKKDLKPVLMITLALVAFSFLMQFMHYRETVKNEPYYTKAFDTISKKEDVNQTIDNELNEASKKRNDALSEIMMYIYGEGYDMNSPPEELPSEMVEKLFFPSYENGIYAPLAETDENILSQLKIQLYAQQNYVSLISDQLVSYDRNVRRGVKDEYILAVSQKLTEDYTEVIEEPYTKITDTRAADSMVSFVSTDMIPLFAVFIILFSRFSSEIQSRRFMSFSATKYGAFNFTLSKILSGYVVFTVFYVIYCVGYFVMFLVFDKNSGALFAPVQICATYELSTEALSLFQYMLVIMATRFVYCIALGSIVMLVSFVCKRTIIAGVAGLVAIALPLILKETYIVNSAIVAKQYVKIILSCDVFNMYHGLNYVDVLGTPVKVYVLFFVFMAFISVIFSAITLAVSTKRGVGVV